MFEIVKAQAIVLVAIASLATAAETPTDASEPARRVRRIEEIVVTAQKKEQSLQDVPISITTLDGEFLKEAGIDEMHDLVRFTPNFEFSTNPCCGSPFIRGFGTPFVDSAFDPTVGLVLDGLFINQAVYYSDPFFDIERIEVLRGPQGTLFGKNSPAGLLNVTTGEPTDEITGYALGKIGGLGVHRIEAALGGPLPAARDWARFRIAVVDTHLEEDVDNTTLDLPEPATKQRAARLRLDLDPLDALEVRLLGEISTSDARAFFFQQADLKPSSIDFLRQYDPRFESDPFDHRSSINLEDDMDRETRRVQTELRYDAGDLGPARGVEIVSVLGWTDIDGDVPSELDFTPADIVNFPSPDLLLYDQKSIELRAAALFAAPWNLGNVDVLAGVYWFRSSFLTSVPTVAGRDFDEYLLSPAGFELVTGVEPPGGAGFPTLESVFRALGEEPPPALDTLEGDSLLPFSDQSADSKALFGEAAWTPVPEWTVILGGRMTFERKDAFLELTCFSPGVLCPAIGAEEYTRHLSRREKNFSPKIALQYRPFEDLTLFATRASGFKSGGFNNFSLVPDGIEVEPEEAVSWEVGAKGTLFDSLAYGATLFHMNVDDMQLQQFEGPQVRVKNAASARTRGLEVDFQWATPWEALSLFGAGAVTDARFLDYTNAQAPHGAESPEQDLSGRRIGFVPRVQANVTPTLVFPLSVPSLPGIGPLFEDGLGGFLSFDVLYRSRVLLDLDLDPRTRQDAYVHMGARVGLSTADEALSLILSVTNLTDADVLEVKTDNVLFPGGFLAQQEFQRNVVLALRYAF